MCVTQVYLTLVSQDHILWFFLSLTGTLASRSFRKGNSQFKYHWLGVKIVISTVLYDLNKFSLFTAGNYYAWENDSDICDDPWNLNIENVISLGILYRKLMCFFQRCSFWEIESKDIYEIMLKDVTLLWNVSQRHTQEL